MAFSLSTKHYAKSHFSAGLFSKPQHAHRNILNVFLLFLENVLCCPSRQPQNQLSPSARDSFASSAITFSLSRTHKLISPFSRHCLCFIRLFAEYEALTRNARKTTIISAVPERQMESSILYRGIDEKNILDGWLYAKAGRCLDDL